MGRLFVSVFFQAEDGIRDIGVTGVQTCALPISPLASIRIASSTILHDVLDLPVRIRDSVASSTKNPVVSIHLSVTQSGWPRSMQLPRSEERRVGKECRYRMGLE